MTILRKVGATLDMSVNAPADLILSMAVAAHHDVEDEHFQMVINGQEMVVSEVEGPSGSRFHVARGLPVGRMTLTYGATVSGTQEPLQATPLEFIESVRPSRYCDSDRMLAVAHAELGEVAGANLLVAASRWANTHLQYVSGSSRPVDSALDTYLARRGVCRDYAHLVITFLRAYNIPTRLVSVYAPGLAPMDFHAIAEACLDGVWYALDATGLAPRESMVRIATGQDTSDTAFMTVTRGLVALHDVQVTAVLEGRDLPVDDPTALVSLT
ncbi:MAG: transglutaminase family protein [Dermatophilaceae bacterium]